MRPFPPSNPAAPGRPNDAAGAVFPSIAESAPPLHIVAGYPRMWFLAAQGTRQESNLLLRYQGRVPARSD
uniref:Uncharacterized protein n=1 Tax=viral metagenome TaxID=1070528 RepID=A0A6M3LBR6_9ZZZZ